MDWLLGLAAAADRCDPEEIREAVVAATRTSPADPGRRGQLRSAIDTLLSRAPESVVASLSPAFAGGLLDDGEHELLARVLDVSTAHAQFGTADAVLRRVTPVDHGVAALPSRILLALVRAAAFSDAARAEQLLAQARDAGPDDGTKPEELAEAQALVRAVADVPVAEGAARRALARVAIERAWRPDAWGRDQGALVALVTRRLKGASDGFGGPLMTYLASVAGPDLERVAKRIGARTAGGASWFTRGSVPPSASVGAMSEPDANAGRGEYLATMRDAAAAERERVRLRERVPVGDPTDSRPVRSRRTRTPAPTGLAVGGVNSGLWWFPLLVYALVLVGLALFLLRRF